MHAQPSDEYDIGTQVFTWRLESDQTKPHFDLFKEEVVVSGQADDEKLIEEAGPRDQTISESELEEEEVILTEKDKPDVPTVPSERSTGQGLLEGPTEESFTMVTAEDIPDTDVGEEFTMVTKEDIPPLDLPISSEDEEADDKSYPDDFTSSSDEKSSVISREDIIASVDAKTAEQDKGKEEAEKDISPASPFEEVHKDLAEDAPEVRVSKKVDAVEFFSESDSEDEDKKMLQREYQAILEDTLTSPGKQKKEPVHEALPMPQEVKGVETGFEKVEEAAPKRSLLEGVELEEDVDTEVSEQEILKPGRYQDMPEDQIQYREIRDVYAAPSQSEKMFDALIDVPVESHLGVESVPDREMKPPKDLLDKSSDVPPSSEEFTWEESLPEKTLTHEDKFLGAEQHRSGIPTELRESDDAYVDEYDVDDEMIIHEDVVQFSSEDFMREHVLETVPEESSIDTSEWDVTQDEGDEALDDQVGTRGDYRRKRGVISVIYFRNFFVLYLHKCY